MYSSVPCNFVKKMSINSQVIVIMIVDVLSILSRPVLPFNLVSCQARQATSSVKGRGICSEKDGPFSCLTPFHFVARVA